MRFISAFTVLFSIARFLFFLCMSGIRTGRRMMIVLKGLRIRPCGEMMGLIVVSGRRMGLVIMEDIAFFVLWSKE
jgi:hypothetical protein